eukprot:452618-Alexandrium_andersonii.AAC.1
MPQEHVAAQAPIRRGHCGPAALLAGEPGLAPSCHVERPGEAQREEPPAAAERGSAARSGRFALAPPGPSGSAGPSARR